MVGTASALTYSDVRDALVLRLREDADRARDREISDPPVLALYDVGATASLGGRGQPLTARLRAG